MHLKSLSLHGFKSFADRTEFEFHPGVTGIVGPNGCGKSNVVDAIRWVLGETSAKALRGGEMSDVIFNGTDRRKPVGMAEVTLTLAGCEEVLGTEYHEVAVTRRVYRDGKSEYRLNGSRCRLKDVSSLFMDTGIGRTAYSIMEQGKIDMLLSSKPEDRRAVFEEAAGITRFKSQKKEALRKLEYTEANLLRVVDILTEVRRQMASMQRQAQKARRYQAVAKDVKILDCHLSHRVFCELSAEREEAGVSLRGLEEEQAKIDMEVELGEQRHHELRAAVLGFDNEIAALRRGLEESRARIAEARGRIGYHGERAGELRAAIERSEREMAAVADQLKLQVEDLEQSRTALDGGKERLGELRGVLEGALGEVREVMERRGKLLASLREWENAVRGAQGRKARAEAQVGSLRGQVESNRQRAKEILGGARELEQELAKLEEGESRLSRAESELAGVATEAEGVLGELEVGRTGLAESCERRRQELGTVRAELVRQESRIEILGQLVEGGDGLEDGAKLVLNGLDDPELYRAGVRGLLSAQLEVEPGYVRAIEAAIEHHLHTVVVADVGLAEAIVTTLKEGSLGEVSLLVEEIAHSFSPPPPASVPEGALAWAASLVLAPPAARRLLAALLSRVLVVEDLAAAWRLRLAMPTTDFVTMDGELVTAEGVVRGGQTKDRASSLLTRGMELRELRVAAEGLRLEVSVAEGRLAEAEAELEELAGRLRVAREEQGTRKGELSRVQGELGQVRQTRGQRQSKLESVQWECEELERRAREAEDKAGELEVEIREATRLEEDARGKEAGLQGELESLERGVEQKQRAANEARTALAVEESSHEAARKQHVPMEARLQQMREGLERRREEIAESHERIRAGELESEQMRGEIERLEAGSEAAEARLDGCQREREDLARELEQLGGRLGELRKRGGQVGSLRGKEEISVTKLDLRIENLLEHVARRYQVSLASFEPDPHALLAALEEQRQLRERGKRRRASLAGEGGVELAMPVEDEVAGSGEEPEDEGAAGMRELVGELPGEPDWELVESIVAELRQRLDAMGSVNLDAIQEFEELEERYQFLEGQHDDLVNSKEELLRVIAKINLETKKRFVETFEQVRANFAITFSELFGEGSRANLILVDEDDPLESGIDIIAKPPGKKLQSITLLSGGERSLTAVALLFSIYMVKPSPFCVLDELDAPLDESNIGRFLDMLDRFVARPEPAGQAGDKVVEDAIQLAKSQFIIVTHNKRTMARADVMYGVTMEEYGVSKPVGIRITGEGGRTTEKTIAAIQ